MAHFNPSDLSRFDNFHILTTPYKAVQNHPITLDILYPQTLKSPPTGSPIIIRFHGGGLFAGSSLFPDFFAPWLLSLANTHSAIIISPNYRLLPESNFADVHADVEDAYNFIHSSLPSYLSSQTNDTIIPDLSRILVSGESAGGYLSLQLSLSHASELRGMIAQYPMIDLKSPYYTTSYEKKISGVPEMPKSIITDHLAKIRAGEVPAIVTEDPRMDRKEIMAVAFQQGMLGEYFDSNDTKMFPLERIRNGEVFPRGGVFICHGIGDSVVTIEGSEKLEEAVREMDQELYFCLEKRQGGHGVDGEVGLQEEWLQKGLGPVVEKWLE